MRTVISRVATVKITNNDSNFYILVVAHNARAESEHDTVKHSLDRIFNDYTANVENFSARWLKTYKLTHGDDIDMFIAQLNENIEAEMSGDDTVI